MNHIELHGISVQDVPDKGSGLAVTAQLDKESSLLALVPKDLILSIKNIWVLAKADRQLREVLEAMGDYARTPRGAILIFLILQMTHTAPSSEPSRVGVPNPFTSYIQFLPSSIQIPTFWSADERLMLVGTSLEAALETKLDSLNREFWSLRNATSSIPWCKQIWWDPECGILSFDDWKLVDAIYRSRALDLPGTGHAMVPCVDFANHASGDATVALYDTDADGNAVLLLRDGKSLSVNDEITITYGDEKGASEMLFSYGFIEETMTSARELYLDLDIPDDDPLRIAKKHVSRAAPGFRLFSQGDLVGWEGPFVWLLCVNEEDGLEFKLLQSTDGDRELRVFWNDGEIRDVSALESLLQADRKWDVFQLRAAVTLRDRIAQQLSALEDSRIDFVDNSSVTDGSTRTSQSATKLRELEATLMFQACEMFENKINTVLATSDIVRQYLATVSQVYEGQQQDDFS